MISCIPSQALVHHHLKNCGHLYHKLLHTIYKVAAINGYKQLIEATKSDTSHKQLKNTLAVNRWTPSGTKQSLDCLRYAVANPAAWKSLSNELQ